MKKTKTILVRLLALLLLAAAVVANGSVDLEGEPWYARISFLILFASGFFTAASLFRSTYRRDQLEAAASSTSMKLFWLITFIALVLVALIQLSGYLQF